MSYIENPCINTYDLRELKAKLQRNFTTSQIQLFRSIPKEEIKYLMEDCNIQAYVDYLRQGRTAIPESFPVLVVKGDKVQVEKFRITFLMTLFDFNGTKDYFPSQFGFESDDYNGKDTVSIAEFPGVAFVVFKAGSITTDNYDEWKAKLIADVIAMRRAKFNPTIVLTTEPIINVIYDNTELFKVVVLDNKKLKGNGSGGQTEVYRQRAEKPAPVSKKDDYTPPAKTYQEPKSARNYKPKKSKEGSSVNLIELMKQDQEDSN